jgi:uncharacterized protein (TIGR02266 family)
MTDQARNAKRYATSQQLLVRCETWGEFVALYATDVSQGGMFVVTDDPPPVLSEVELRLVLPEGHEMPLRARVVHVIEPAQAAHARREPGVGIELIGLDGPTREQIHQLVEFARWQGTSLAPTATLASHMFELNAGASPAQVMQSLAPAQAAPNAPVNATPREAIPSARVINGETGSSGVRRASSVPARQEGAQTSSSGAPRKRRQESDPTSASPSKRASAEPAAPPAAPPPPPPKPTDMLQLKIGMSHLAAKRFGEAHKHLQKMLEANPGDPEVIKWLYTTIARKAVQSNDEAGARQAYEKVLSISEDVHEARKYVRELEQRKRIESLPFGRFFAKKK